MVWLNRLSDYELKLKSRYILSNNWGKKKIITPGTGERLKNGENSKFRLVADAWRNWFFVYVSISFAFNRICLLVLRVYLG